MSRVIGRWYGLCGPCVNNVHIILIDLLKKQAWTNNTNSYLFWTKHIIIKQPDNTLHYLQYQHCKQRTTLQTNSSQSTIFYTTHNTHSSTQQSAIPITLHRLTTNPPHTAASYTTCNTQPYLITLFILRDCSTSHYQNSVLGVAKSINSTSADSRSAVYEVDLL